MKAVHVRVLVGAYWRPESGKQSGMIVVEW